MVAQKIMQSWRRAQRILVGIGAVMGLPLTAAPAATLVGFDDVPVSTIEVGLNSGFRFSGFRTQNGSMGGGWRTGIVSPQQAAFASFGRPVRITKADPASAFTFNSGYFTAAFDNVAVTVEGIRRGQSTRLDQFTVTTEAPTYRLFDWTDVDLIRISGVKSNGGSPIIIYDDFLFDAALTPPPAAVPEPATWALMICGFGLIGGAARRRNLASVTNTSA